MILNELKKEIRTRYISKSIIIINILWVTITIAQILVQFIPYFDVSLKINSNPIDLYIFTASFTIITFSNQTMFSLRITNEKFLGILECIVISPVSIFRYSIARAIVCLIENMWTFIIFFITSICFFDIHILNSFYYLLLSSVLSIIWGIFFNLLNIFIRDIRVLYLIIDEPSELLSGSIVPLSFLPTFASIIGIFYPQTWLLLILRSSYNISLLIEASLYVISFVFISYLFSRLGETFKQNWSNY